MKEVYSEIFKVLDKHKDTIIFDVDNLKRESELHLFGLKLRDEYGLEVNPLEIYNTDWLELKRFVNLGWYGGDRPRMVFASETGEQPNNEHLIVFSFCTGAYILGEHYPQELFNEFWEELKTYKWSYCDNLNHDLYFKLEDAAELFTKFESILNKYKELSILQEKQMRLERLQKELNELKKS